MRLFSDSIGRKAVMAVTGLLLVVFLIGHLLGNLTIFVTGAPRGAELKILIEKISGNIAYAKVFKE